MPPAVAAALRRTTRDGYLHVARDGRMLLFARGREIGQHLVLRHVSQKLLTEVIGVEWSLAHEEAEHLEHGISPRSPNCSSNVLDAKAAAPTESHCSAECPSSAAN